MIRGKTQHFHGPPASFPVAQRRAKQHVGLPRCLCINICFQLQPQKVEKARKPRSVEAVTLFHSQSSVNSNSWKGPSLSGLSGHSA